MVLTKKLELNMMLLDNLKEYLKKTKVVNNPPYEYEFLINLPENEYPKYLSKIFFYNTGEKLDLTHPKTFNEKIQWLKLYDSSPLKTRLTDKVLVRDWVKEKIGEEYLKPVLQICKNFDDIDFDKLPDKFIIKTNHGSKWHYIIKDKEAFVQKKELVNFVRNKFNGWMEQTFFPWAGFEMQYKYIKPQILIEPYLVTQENPNPVEYEVYCFNGKPRIYQKIKYSLPCVVSLYDEEFNQSEFSFNPKYIVNFEEASENLKKASILSETLSDGFKLVRVDWLEYNEKIYFNEMTFTPYSGFYPIGRKNNLKLGNMLKLK